MRGLERLTERLTEIHRGRRFTPEFEAYLDSALQGEVADVPLYGQKPIAICYGKDSGGSQAAKIVVSFGEELERHFGVKGEADGSIRVIDQGLVSRREVSRF